MKHSGALVKQGLINLAKVFRDVGDPSNSHSRGEMMKLISGGFSRIEKQVTGWINCVEEAHYEMDRDRKAMELSNYRHKFKTDEKIEQFIKNTQEELFKKGFEVQNSLYDRQAAIDHELTRFKGSLLDLE